MIGCLILHDLLRYDATTGKLFWRERTAKHFAQTGNGGEANAARWNKMFAGKEAFTGKNSRGYHTGSIFGHTYKAHRVIWALEHDEWPEHDIDHINGEKTDNRLANLRAVTRAENQKNKPLYRRNATGAVGVCWVQSKEKWQARIKADNRDRNLGYFASFSEALAARKAAEIAFGFHENHGR